MPILEGFTDTELDQNVVEAVKALHVAKAVYQRSLENIEGQHLRALEAAHDGESDACAGVHAQVDAVRSLF